MTKLEQQLREELQRWKLAGMQPGIAMPAVPGTLFEIDVRTEAVVKLLVEKEVFTQEEADEMYQKCMLEKLTMIREHHEEAQRAEMLVAKTRLLGPDGKVIGNGS